MLGLKKNFRNKIKKIKKKELISLVLLLLILGYVLWLLFDTHILQKDLAGNLLTGESTYGDLPFHLSTISQIAYGNIYPPEHPFFSGHSLTYPYLINLLSVGLVRLGLSLRDSIILPGIFFALITTEVLYFFYKKVSNNHTVALLSSLLFWLYGGLGFYYFFKDIVLQGFFINYISDPGKFSDYSHLFSENIHWNNYLSRIVVPERAVLLGIPIGLVILYLLFIRKKRGLKLDKNFFIAALLTGILPIAHTHTFLTYSLIIPFLALFEVNKKNYKKWLLKWAVFGAVVLIVASPQLVKIFSHIGNERSFIRFHIGWMAEPGLKNFIIFWFKNGGILIPVMGASLFIKKINITTKKLVLAGFFVLIGVNLFLFQPFNWDNIKLLFWVQIFGVLAASTVLVFIWKKWGMAGKITSVVILLGLTLSSQLSIYREIRLQHVLFSKEEVGLAEWVKNNTPTDALFLTAPVHNSFVNNLAGRRIYMGYQGLLWTQGIDYSQREIDLKEIYRGTKNVSVLLDSNNIDYIVIGPKEVADLEVNVGFFEKSYCLVKQTDNYEIFQISDCMQKGN